MSIPNQSIDVSEIERKYQQIFASFLTQLLCQCAQHELVRNSLGDSLLQTIQKQAKALSVQDANIDVKNEIKGLLVDLLHNVKWLEEKGTTLSDKLKADSQRVKDASLNNQYVAWLTDVGRGRFQQALEMGWFVRRETSMLPLRTNATLVALFSASDVVAGSPTEAALKMALDSAWRSYSNYYKDCCFLRKKLAPDFENKVQEIFSILKTIDDRIAAREAEKAWQEELEQEEEELRGQRDTNVHLYGTNPVEDPEPFDWYRDEEDNHYYSSTQDNYCQVNPANGLPMMGNSMVDIHGNVYGTDFF